MRLSATFSFLVGASLLLAGCTQSGEQERDPEELGVVGPDEDPDPSEDSGPIEAPAARTEVVAKVTQPTQAIGVPGGGGDILILERRGQVHLLPAGADETILLLDISERVDSQGGRERGLKSAAFHPDFQENGILFLVHDGTLDEETRAGVGHVTRTFADPANLAAGLQEGDDLLVIDYPENWFHNTAGIKFGPDGMMYIASGDGGGWRYDAQRTHNLWGSILRLDVDQAEGYTIPADNPFIDDPEVLDEIWLYGFRNPWRFDFHPDTGDLFIANTGEDSVESVYLFPAAGDAPRNHGWPYYEGNQTLETHHGEPPEEINFPIVNYPTREEGRCAMIGGAVYQGDAFPGLQGSFVFGDHCSGDVMFIQQAEGEWVLTPWFTTSMMFMSIDRDDDGEILISGIRGEIHRIIPE